MPRDRLRAAWTGLGRGWTDPSVRAALVVFAAARLTLGLWLPFVRNVVYPVALPADPRARPYAGVAVETNPWLEAWQRYDTTHYQAIAERGYAAFDEALFTPPLYPMLMWLAAGLVGGNTLLAGVLVSNLAYLAALVVLYRLALREMQEHATARRTLIYLACFPSAFFFLAAYTESLFLLAVLLFLTAARNKNWILAGWWAGAAALTRTPGLMLLVPLGYLALEAWRSERDGRGFAGIVVAGACAALFPLYIWVSYGWPPWAIVSDAFQRGNTLTWPGLNVVRSFSTLLAGRLGPPDVFDLVFTLAFLAMAWPVWQRLPRLYAVYYLSIFALYLTRMGTMQPLFGMTRYVLVLVPAFMVLAVWGRDRRVNRVVIYLSIPLLLFMSGVFALWGWIG